MLNKYQALKFDFLNKFQITIPNFRKLVIRKLMLVWGLGFEKLII